MKKSIFLVFVIFIFMLTSCASKNVSNKVKNVGFLADMKIEMENFKVSGKIEKSDNEVLSFIVSEPFFVKGMRVSLNLKEKKSYTVAFNDISIEFGDKPTKLIDTLLFVLKVYGNSLDDGSLSIKKNGDSVELDIKSIGVKVDIDNIIYK